MSPFRLHRIAVLLFGLLPLQGGARGVETFRFDPLHTQITFFVDHLGFSQASGRLRIKDGWFQFDPADLRSARADLRIDLDTLDFGDAQWNAAVRSSQFLDTARWPTARFTSTAVELDAPDRGTLRGDLRLHGVTRPVALTFTFNRIGNDPYAFRRKAGFSARATLRRGDFGLTRYAGVVGDAVELRIEVEGVRERGNGPAIDDEEPAPDEPAKH